MMYVVEMASCRMTYMPSFMKICIGVQVIILRFNLRDVRDCNVGVTDGKGYLK
jgi:hypothetical protein